MTDIEKILLAEALFWQGGGVMMTEREILEFCEGIEGIELEDDDLDEVILLLEDRL